MDCTAAEDISDQSTVKFVEDASLKSGDNTSKVTGETGLLVENDGEEIDKAIKYMKNTMQLVSHYEESDRIEEKVSTVFLAHVHSLLDE